MMNSSSIQLDSYEMYPKKYHQNSSAVYNSVDGRKDHSHRNMSYEQDNTDLHNYHQEKERNNTLVILGSGDLSQAMVMCFSRKGFRVVVGSRNPDKSRHRIESFGGEAKLIHEAVGESDVILIAIPFEAYLTLDARMLAGKIVIDASNRPPNYDRRTQSLAVQLQQMLPHSHVVKAFNTLSAYELQLGRTQGSKEIPICSNSGTAKSRVSGILRELGFLPVDCGNLKNSQSVEEIPMRFFPEWKFPVILASCIWIFTWIFLLFRFDLCKNFESEYEWRWYYFQPLLLQNTSMSCSGTAITLLACCYFPGVIAAYIQIYRKTKYSEFPSWLDRWLKGRKQIGLIALFEVVIHFILAVGDFLSYGLYAWRDYGFWTAGGLSFTLLIILGICSLPSIASSLSWREFSFVQRYLGWWSLTLATLHVIFMNWGALVHDQLECIFLPSLAQLYILFPLLTIVLKLPLLLPFVNSYVQDIRRGKMN